MTYIIESSANFTRPDNTTAYAVADLVANSATAGSVVPMSFVFKSADKVAGQSIFIRRARVFSTDTSVTSASYRLHLYTSLPVPVNGDNAAFSTPKTGYVGALDVTLDRTFSDGSFGVALPMSGSELNIISTSETIYGLLEARAAKTPDALEVITITLEAHRY